MLYGMSRSARLRHGFQVLSRDYALRAASSSGRSGGERVASRSAAVLGRWFEPSPVAPPSTARPGLAQVGSVW